VSENVAFSYRETAGTLTPEGVEALGISFRDKSAVSLNGLPATLVEGVSVSDPSTGVLLLALGSDKMTALVYGFYNAENKAEAAAARNSLLSCVFNPSGLKNASGDYSLSTSGTRFKFSDEVGGVRYYTVNGARADSPEDAFYTGAAADEFVPPDARKTYAEAAMAKFLSSYSPYSVISTRPINCGGLSGIETTAEFDGRTVRTKTASGANVKRVRKARAYQALLFDENGGKIYVFSGIANVDVDAYVPQFIKITSTFALK
jgi:hypothetical protein